MPNGRDLLNYMNILSHHFREFGSPVMMGGDADAASKCILAVRSNQELLILVSLFSVNKDIFDKSRVKDPHYSGPSFASIDQLRKSGYLRWYTVPQDFLSSSFYNLCLPQLKYI